MSEFATALIVRPEPDGRSWTLMEPLVYETDFATIEVPAGTMTDFASTPRLLWPIFPPFGRYNRAAVIHDYLYRNGLATRARADAIFLEAMKATGVATWRRVFMYLAVRAFGWRAYRGKLQKQAANL